MNTTLTQAKAYALAQIENFGLPDVYNLELSLQKGIQLAEQLGADSEIVQFGCIMMDCKLGEAFSLGKVGDHIKMGYEARLEFVHENKISEDISIRVGACILEHHGTIGFSSLESEIIANADCYRFLHPKGIIRYIQQVQNHHPVGFEESIRQVQKKYEEKKKILSLDICKQELEPYIKSFDGIFEGFFR